MKDRHDQTGPATPFERNFYIFVMTVFLALLAAEIINDFRPVKLAALFFILFWGPLVALHEAGHALLAGLLGWEVRRVVIGLNREVGRFHVHGVPVIVKLLPLGGYMSPVPRTLSRARLKLAIIYLAGPGIELLLLALLVVLFGRTLFLTPSEDIGVIALQSLGVAILYGAISNLLPFPMRENGLTVYSDGLGLLRCFTMNEHEFAALMEAEPDEDGWERGDDCCATDRDPECWR